MKMNMKVQTHERQKCTNTTKHKYKKNKNIYKKRKTKGKCLPKHKKIKTCDLKIVQ